MAILLPSQRNAFFLALRDAEFDPREFAWEEWQLDGSSLTALVHVPSQAGYSFAVGRNPRGWIARFSPGLDETETVTTWSGWANVLQSVPTWLLMLRRELGQTDLWGSLGEAAPLVVASLDDEQDDNRPFSADEQTVVAGRLDEIRRFLEQAHELDQHQKGAILRRLDYLQDAATRVGRKDWRIMAAGVIVNVVIALGLNPPLARELFAFVGTVIRPLLGG
jgi:hypothetical protein